MAAWLRLEEINDVSSSSSCSSPGHETAQLHHSLPGGADWPGVAAHWVTSGVQYGHWSLQELHTSSSSSYRATVRALVSSMSHGSAVQQRRVATMGPLLGHSPAAASTAALQQQGLSQLRCVQSVYSRYSVDSQ